GGGDAGVSTTTTRQAPAIRWRDRVRRRVGASAVVRVGLAALAGVGTLLVSDRVGLALARATGSLDAGFVTTWGVIILAACAALASPVVRRRWHRVPVVVILAYVSAPGF